MNNTINEIKNSLEGINSTINSTMEYYSAIKRNEIELFVVRGMDVETVIQNEVSQKEKIKYHMLTHICGIQKKNSGSEELRGRTGIKTQT